MARYVTYDVRSMTKLFGRVPLPFDPDQVASIQVAAESSDSGRSTPINLAMIPKDRTLYLSNLISRQESG